jgi:hypothetical protein
MQVNTNETNLKLKIELLDDAGSPITGVAFSDSNLTVSYLLETGTSYIPTVLFAGTAGTYLSDSWVEIGDGIYQYCLPNAAIVANTATLLKVRYSPNRAQYDTVEATIQQCPTTTSSGGSSSTSIEDLVTAQNTIGPLRVKTKDMEVEQHDILKMQRVLERANASAPSLSSLSFVLGRPKCIPTERDTPCGDCCEDI